MPRNEHTRQLREAPNVKKLSEQLTDLSNRAKKTEDVVDAAKAKDRERLDAQKAQLRSSINAEKTRIDERATKAQADVQSKWQTFRTAMDDHFAELHAKREQHKAERDLKHVERRADDAEQEAADAIDFAIYALEYAQYAIVEATIARADADDMALKS
jgi:hypothetical protein